MKYIGIKISRIEVKINELGMRILTDMQSKNKSNFKLVR